MKADALTLRALVQRLIIAEILARPGESPLARRPLRSPPPLPVERRPDEPEPKS